MKIELLGDIKKNILLEKYILNTTKKLGINPYSNYQVPFWCYDVPDDTFQIILKEIMELCNQGKEIRIHLNSLGGIYQKQNNILSIADNPKVLVNHSGILWGKIMPTEFLIDQISNLNKIMEIYNSNHEKSMTNNFFIPIGFSDEFINLKYFDLFRFDKVNSDFFSEFASSIELEIEKFEFRFHV